MIFLYIIFLFLCLKTVYYGNLSSVFDIFTLFSHVGFALVFLKSKYSEIVISLLFYMISIYFFIKLLFGTNPNEIIIYSENIIIFIFLALSISYYFIRYINKREIILHPALIVCIASFITMGRSGIITSILLLILIINYKFNWKFKYIFFLILPISFLSNSFINNIQLFMYQISTRFGTRSPIEDNVRFNIWSDYFNQLTPERFIWGFDKSLDYSFYGHNQPHNSFLSGQQILGITMLLIILLLIFTIIKLYSEKQHFPLILLIILLIRSSTDMVLFTGNFDFVYISIIIYSFSNYKKKKQLIFLNMKGGRIQSSYLK